MMRTKTIIEVPTGEIYVSEGEHGLLEYLSLRDYGQDMNVKADFLGLTREINSVPDCATLPLSKKWVITISTQYGCSMNCKFCDVPKVGPGKNATLKDLNDQIVSVLKSHINVRRTNRLNVHFARMGEPTWNKYVLDCAEQLPELAESWLISSVVHPVVSTMLPKNNINLETFLHAWVNLKNILYNGDAGLQFSINSTDDAQRDYLFSGNSLSLEEIAKIGADLPRPKGRKYALNFALADNSIIDGKRLRELFDPLKFMCKITPMHNTSECIKNGIATEDGYTQYTPYRNVEADLINNGFDVLVFIPSYAEDYGLITCGNAILSGSTPRTKYKRIDINYGD